MCNNRGGQASRGFSFSSSFSFFFSFSRQLVGHSISTETSVSLPNIESIDDPQRERKREREPIFSRGTMGTTSVTANGTFRVQTFRSFTSSTCTTTVKTSIVSPTTDFLRIIPRATAMVTASNLPAGSPFIVGDGIRF